MNGLYHVDTFEEILGIGDNAVDIVITDPPYDFSDIQKKKLLSHFYRVSKTGVIIFGPPENQWPEANQYGFWMKPISTKNTSKKYSRFIEMIFFYDNLKWNSKRHWSQYTNVFTDLVDDSKLHPHAKPESLMERLIKNHTDEGDLIFDPFCGSGTTLICAKKLNRDFLGYENSLQYYDITEERLSL